MDKKIKKSSIVKSEVMTKLALSTKTLLIIAMAATLFVGYSFAALAVKNVAEMSLEISTNNLREVKSPVIKDDERELREQFDDHFITTLETDEDLWIGAVSPVAYDLDGDGKKEIIVQTQNSSSNNPYSKLYILDDEGNTLHETSVNCYINPRSFPTIVSISNVPYIAMYCRLGGNNSVMFYDGEGEFFREFQLGGMFPGLGVYDSLVARDINNDGQVELIFGVWDGVNSGAYLYVVDLEGSNFNNFPIILENAYFAEHNTPIIANLNNDINDEIVVSFNSVGEDGDPGTPDDQNYIRAYSAAGNQLWSYDNGNAWMKSDPVAYDFDNDGYDEIVNISESGLIILNRFGEVVQNVVISGGMAHSNPAIADVNNDGEKEIIFGYGYGLYVYTFNGSQLLHFTNNWLVHHPIVIGDINGDGINDIIFNSDDNIKAIDISGELLDGFPLMLDDTIAYSSPLVIDVNGDRRLDLITSTNWGDPNIGHIHIWHLQDSTQSLSPWPMYQHDAQHTGAYTEVPLCRNNVLEPGEECEHGVQACGLAINYCSSACECESVHSYIKPTY